jgi:hypothetical protein
MSYKEAVRGEYEFRMIIKVELERKEKSQPDRRNMRK